MSTSRRPFVSHGPFAVFVALATRVAPVWVMRPFRPQGPIEVSVALWFAPWLLLGAGALAIAAGGGGGPGRYRRGC